MVKKGDGILTPFENMAKDISKFGNSAKKTINTVINGASDYSPKVRKILSDYGDDHVREITIGRTPVSEVLTKVLSTASSNFKENINNMPYDKLFHLFILVRLDGRTIRIEKNEVINIDLISKLTPDTELKKVSEIPMPTITLNQFLANGKSFMGSEKFFRYSARDNNCQDFILGLFYGSNIGNKEERDFIKQDTKQLFNNTGSLRQFANTITDVGGRFNALMNGGEIKKLKMRGDNGLTDKQIMAILKQKRIQCHGCFVKDELKSIKNGNYIINLNGQSHWCALVRKGDEYCWFDSYGFPPPEEVEDLINGTYFYNKYEIQGLEQTSCGYYCIAFLIWCNQYKKQELDKNFAAFLDLFSKNKTNNQLIIKNILNLK
jgi:hypothetical protein